MIAIVTGAAGFIGSSLSRRLLEGGDEVIGIDCMTAAYDRQQKAHNLEPLLDHPHFELLSPDLAEEVPADAVHAADVVFHLAGQASVTASWGAGFAPYAHHNIEATQRLLESCVGAGLRRFVYGSSSSIYGNAASLPTPETELPRPVSPYGVSKLAGEHLALAYHRTWDLPVTALRFFTVYGPAQRPDMAFHKLFKAALRGDPFRVWGDGTATRDFTFIDDIVTGLVAAADADWDGVANLGGGHRTSIRRLLALVEELTGPIDVRYEAPAAGDVSDTSADVRVAAAALGYHPSTDLRTGLAAMHRWAVHEFDRVPVRA
jgi:nucleoside-diphosphate-sugar epimerase